MVCSARSLFSGDDQKTEGRRSDCLHGTKQMKRKGASIDGFEEYDNLTFDNVATHQDLSEQESKARGSAVSRQMMTNETTDSQKKIFRRRWDAPGKQEIQEARFEPCSSKCGLL